MPPHTAVPPAEVDSGLACLLMLARFFGVPANAEPLTHQFTESGKTFGETELLLAAKHLGFKAGAVESDWSRLPHMALPAIAQQKDGRYVVVARADAEKILVQDPAEPKPLLLPRAIFEEAWSGRLILLTKRANLRPEDRPGMTVAVEIKTGQRRLIEYFLSPLIQAGPESIRER